MGTTLKVQVLPKVGHTIEVKRNCGRVTDRGKAAWSAAAGRRTETGYEAVVQGERAKNREALVAKGRCRKSGGRAPKICGYLNGWKAYFRLAETPRTFRNLDEWIRYRLRAIQLKQWRRGKTIYRELRACGTPHRENPAAPIPIWNQLAAGLVITWP